MRSLVKLIAKLRRENTALRNQVARLDAELNGTEYDDVLTEECNATPSDEHWFCDTCGSYSRYDEYCNCDW